MITLYVLSGLFASGAVGLAWLLWRERRRDVEHRPHYPAAVAGDD